MKRIAITGFFNKRRTILGNALSAMTKFDYIAGPSFSTVAAKYKMDYDKEKCQWPDSFIYCLDAFTQRIIAEKNLEDFYITDGGVFNEICWLKCRYPHNELIYERSMIVSLEKVVTDYASKEYDFIFHIETGDPSNVSDQCLKQIYKNYDLKHHIIDTPNDEDALNQNLGQHTAKLMSF